MSGPAPHVDRGARTQRGRRSSRGRRRGAWRRWCGLDELLVRECLTPPSQCPPGRLPRRPPCLQRPPPLVRNGRWEGAKPLPRVVSLLPPAAPDVPKPATEAKEFSQGAVLALIAHQVATGEKTREGTDSAAEKRAAWAAATAAVNAASPQEYTGKQARAAVGCARGRCLFPPCASRHDGCSDACSAPP